MRARWTTARLQVSVTRGTAAKKSRIGKRREIIDGNDQKRRRPTRLVTPKLTKSVSDINLTILVSFIFSGSINMSHPGLPPLPKSLSGLELTQQQIQQQINQSNNYQNVIQAHQQNQLNSFDSQRSLTSSSSSSISRKTSSLDNQLAILRREMVSSLIK